MIAVAIDEAADAIRDYIRDHTDGITYPVLMDSDHLLTELYAISNVPTVVLIDENDTIEFRGLVTDDNGNADITWYKVEAENYESIHNHNAYACIEKG